MTRPRQSKARPRCWALNRTPIFSSTPEVPGSSLTVPSAAGSGPCSAATAVSIWSMMTPASSLRPWVSSQRGLSGMYCRRNSTPTARGTPESMAMRQPTRRPKTRSDRKLTATSEPRMTPIQKVEPMIRLAVPRDACRDELIDGGGDGGVLAADACAGEHAAQGESPQIPGAGRGRGRAGVERKRPQEEAFAPVDIRQVAEDECADDRAGKIPGGRDA